MCVFHAHVRKMSYAAERLKELRERASPRLTVRAMAEKLGMPSSSYTRYETPARYKKAYLPIPLARNIAKILADHGIDQSEVMALALDEQLSAGQELSSSEEQLLDRFRGLNVDQRRLLLELVDAMGNAATAPRGDQLMFHSPKEGFRVDAPR